jgi:hypothetical protein
MVLFFNITYGNEALIVLLNAATVMSLFVNLCSITQSRYDVIVVSYL